MQERKSETLQQGKFVVKDVNFLVNKGSYGYETFNSTFKLIQQKQRNTLQLAKCVVKDVNFHVNKCSYVYKNSSIKRIK